MAASRVVDLTFVDALIVVTHRPNDQEPLVRPDLVQDLEAIVGRVHELAHGQEVRVSVAHPRHLKKRESKRI